MQMFEYESGKLQSQNGASSPLWLCLCVIMIAVWAIATAIFIRAGIRQTPEFQQIDATYYAKMLAYERLETTPDVVFVGSSRIQLHVNSEIVEQTAADHGCEGITVFNMGVGGGIATNAKFMTEWLLAHDIKPKKIFIEPKGAEWYGMLPTKRNFFLTPYWPDRFWQENFYSYEMRDNDGIAPIEARFNILTRSLSVFFNYGAVQLLYDGEYERPEFEVLGIRGFRGQEERISKASSGYRKYMKYREDEPNPNGVKLKAYENAYQSVSPDDRLAEVFGPSHLIFDSMQPDDLSLMGVILPPPTKWSQSELDSFDYKGVEIPVITAPISELPIMDNPDMYVDLSHLWHDGHREYSRYIARDVCKALQR